MAPLDSLDPNDARDPAFGRTIVIAIAVCCLMVGVVFRAVAAGDYLWLDEQHTAWVANADLADVAPRAADGNQTPLFFYACWAAIKCGGQSALSVRLPSLLCGLALMAVVSLFVYRRTLCAASLLVVSVFFLLDYDAVFYASEARPYAMVQLLGVIQAAVFFAWVGTIGELPEVVGASSHRATRSLEAPATVDRTDQWATKTGWGFATAVLAAILFYAHPTAMLLMVAEFIFVVGLFVSQGKIPWAKLLSTAVLFFVLILPGVIMISFVWQRRENWSTVSEPNKVFIALAEQTTLMILLPLAMLFLDRFWPGGKFSAESKSADSSRLLAFVACWAIVPQLLIASLDASGWVHLAIGRYAIVGAVAFPIFAAIAIARLRNDLLKWIATVSIVGLLAYYCSVPQQFSAGGFRHENWQEVVRIINAEDDSLPVFLVANLIEDKWAETDQTERFQRYLGFPLRGIPRLASPQRIVPRPTQGKILSAENLALIEEKGGGLVVVRDSEIYRDAIRLEILSVLQENAQTRSADLFGAPIEDPRPNNVHLFLIKSSQPPP